MRKLTPLASEVRQASNDLRLRVGHTADLSHDELQNARLLLDLVFSDDMTDADWEHALGGVHVIAWHGAQIIGHASVIQRRLLYRDRALRAGYVEGVGVHPAHQRRGVGGRMMEVLEGVIARAFQLGALGASDAGAAFYRKRGWRLWRGPLSALTPGGVQPTPEEQGGVFVLPVGPELDLDEALIADFRDGDVW